VKSLVCYLRVEREGRWRDRYEYVSDSAVQDGTWFCGTKYKGTT